MTKKDYIKFVDILSKHQVSNSLIVELTEYFKSDNPNFQASKFIYYYQMKKTHQRLLKDKKIKFENEHLN